MRWVRGCGTREGSEMSEQAKQQKKKNAYTGWGVDRWAHGQCVNPTGSGWDVDKGWSHGVTRHRGWGQLAPLENENECKQRETTKKKGLTLGHGQRGPKARCQGNTAQSKRVPGKNCQQGEKNKEKIRKTYRC